MIVLPGYNLRDGIYHGKGHRIYRGIREADNAEVTLKFPISQQPNHKDIDNLRHEYKILKLLNIPGVSKAYDLIAHEFNCVLVLAYVPGISLREFLNQKQIGLADFFNIALQLTNIVSELHLKKIIHKDINPANIIIDPETHKVTLIDFNIASELHHEFNEYHTITELEGTLAYSSPEQTGRMNRLLDYRTDFYSLGVTFYEMLTGRLPFDYVDSLELVHALLAKKPKNLRELRRDIPESLIAIIDKMMAKTPEDRYGSAVGIHQDLIESQKQFQNHYNTEFTVGKRDINDQLNISQKLYGREVPVSNLLAAFERITKGRKEVIFISGYSGIGKTAVVREIYKPVSRDKGYFISGKYDLLQKTHPYSAIIEAFDNLVKRILRQSPADLHNIEVAILKAVGKNGRIICDVIPNVAHIIGKQPSVNELPPLESKNRFMQTFQNFVRVLATAEHPLVLFLDDLQWIDSASLQLLSLLLGDEELHYFLLIGAFRGNEVDVDHPLMTFSRELAKQDAPITNIYLEALGINDVKDLLADTLNSKSENISDLAKLTFDKTQGNPFFMNEFIVKLYQDKILRYSYDDNTWQWDLSAVTVQDVTYNVIDLLAHRIQKLSPNVQLLLKLAACIGHTFQLSTLATISKMHPDKVAEYLWEAINGNFIYLIGNNYRLPSLHLNAETFADNNIEFRFLHDKIQQTAYNLIESQQRKLTHLSIGRLLADNIDLLQDNEQLFSILNQFNQALDLIESPEEKNKLIKANYLAGKKAKSSNAYQAAHRYFMAGISLLNEASWQNNYVLSFSIYKENAECLHLIGELDSAEKQFKFLITKSNNLMDKAGIYEKYLLMLSANNRKAEVLTIGIEALKLLGLTFPKKVTIFHVYWSIFQIRWQIGFRKIENVELKPAIEPRVAMIDRIALPVFTSAIMMDYNLYLYLNNERVKTCLRYGYIRPTLNTLLAFGMNLIHLFGQKESGFAFVKLAEKIKAQSPELFQDFAGEYYTLGNYITFLRNPISNACDDLMHAYQLGLQQGELQFTSFSIMAYNSSMLNSGKPLEESSQALQIYKAFKSRSKAKEYDEYLAYMQKYVLDLQTKSLPVMPSAKELNVQVSNYKIKLESALIYMLAVEKYSIFGHMEDAVTAYQDYIPYQVYTRTNFGSKLVWFYAALAHITLYKTTDTNKDFHLKSFKQLYKKLKRVVDSFPVNYKCYERILAAEMAEVYAKPALAMDLYEESIKASQTANNQLACGLAREYAAKFYLRIKKPSITQTYLNQAIITFNQWGSLAKVAQLEKLYTSLFPEYLDVAPIHSSSLQTTTSTTRVTNFNMLSILKSAQIMSSEVHLKKLLGQLLSILLENAGAQRVVLLTANQMEWFVEAEGTIENKNIYNILSKPISQEINIPHTLINYAQRTQEVIVMKQLDEIETRYSDDLYLMTVKPKSFLVLPVFYQGSLKYLLYFENKSLDNSFSSEQINTLQLLASQAAIALENARLYEQASHDSLTGLANRSLLYSSFQQAVLENRNQMESIALFFIDLDGFKSINDTLGHEIGDKLLIKFSDKISGLVADNDLAARLGGDEFVVMMRQVTSKKQVIALAEKLMEAFRIPIEINGSTLQTFASIGISLYMNDGATIQTILSQADNALYKVKAEGKNGYAFYTQASDTKDNEAHELALKDAILKNQFVIYYQPIINRSNEITHVEALIRWQHPLVGVISASEFIPLAEKTGIIIKIGEWVLNAVCEQISNWKKLGLKTTAVAINLSGLQFRHQDLPMLIKATMEKYSIRPEELEIEITESIFIEPTPAMLEALNNLKSIGTKLTLDDFGTIYSSFSYMRNFLPDKIKIDKSFVQNLAVNPRDRSITKAMIEMAHSLNTLVIAEGVETKEQLAILKEQGADGFQGYFISHPVDEFKVVDLITAEKFLLTANEKK